MANPSVTWTLTNGTVIDAGLFNQNYTDIINALTDGTKDLTISALTVGGAADFNSSVALGTNVSYELAPIALYRAPTVRMVWSTAAAILVKSGRYFLGNKVYTNGSDITWTWVASGQNGGLDTGAEGSSTWYYMYGVLIGGAFGAVASTTAPTAVFDTTLGGAASLNTNVYLGAFYNNSSSDIISFGQNGARFDLHDRTGSVSHTGNTTLTSKTIIAPSTASHIYGRVEASGTVGASLCQVNGNNATNDELGQLLSVSGTPNYAFVMVPVVAATTVYLKVDNASNTVNFVVLGWLDKWL